MRRPGVALALQAIVAGGRAAFYGGAFGEGLLALGAGYFTEADLARVQADWVEPLQASAFGVELSTIGPNSQGYLTLGAARLARAGRRARRIRTTRSGPTCSSRPRRPPRSTVPTCSTRRPTGRPCSPRSRPGPTSSTSQRAGRRPVAAAAGDTTYLCTADASGLAVSLIQSNASGFGSWLVEPTTGINLHNRGLGFSLAPGHPAEYRPGARPPHTLCPAMATRDGELAAVFGTMGGDAQPQILLQVAARLFAHGASPADAVGAPRWVLRGAGDRVRHVDERRPADRRRRGPRAARRGAPVSLERGHAVDVAPAFDSGFGHAHAIVVEPGGTLAAAADPRARVGSAAGV